jgi:hypothetical protein
VYDLVDIVARYHKALDDVRPFFGLFQLVSGAAYHHFVTVLYKCLEQFF